MDFGILEIPAVVIAFLASFSLLILNRGHRITLFLSLLYLAQFLLILSVWRLELAVVKLVTGWMTAAIIGVTLVNKSINLEDSEENVSLGVFFRMISGFFVLLLGISFGPTLMAMVDIFRPPQVYGALFVIGMGILKLGLSNYPIHVILGLLVTLSGFEILYASLEDSVLIAGLLAITNLGLALTAAYLHVIPDFPELEGDN